MKYIFLASILQLSIMNGLFCQVNNESSIKLGINIDSCIIPENNDNILIECKIINCSNFNYLLPNSFINELRIYDINETLLELPKNIHIEESGNTKINGQGSYLNPGKQISFITPLKTFFLYNLKKDQKLYLQIILNPIYNGRKTKGQSNKISIIDKPIISEKVLIRMCE